MFATRPYPEDYQLSAEQVLTQLWAIPNDTPSGSVCGEEQWQQFSFCFYAFGSTLHHWHKLACLQLLVAFELVLQQVQYTS